MRVVVVGSGASAVHFAATVLDRGHDVVLVDVGRTNNASPVRPEDDFDQLKHRLDDPVTHLLGERFESVTYPGRDGEYYGFPPQKLYVFEPVPGTETESTGFAPLQSFARGGLAETWTAGCFPFHDDELADFPFGWEELRPAYAEVARRIGVSGEEDDLASRYPWHENVQPAVEPDEHSRRLLERARAKRSELAALGFTVGRSRVAVLTQDREGRSACRRLGRCLLGCPVGSLWTPSIGVRELIGRSGFDHREGRRVTHLLVDGEDRRVTGVAVRGPDGTAEEIRADAVALGAGTLGSTRIFLQTWRRLTGEVPKLPGLMDNRQVLLPFVNLGMIPRAHQAATYQYHQITMRLEAADPREAVHGLVTTLKAASIHPILQDLPFDLRTSTFLFRNLHAALGLVNVNFADHRRDDCWVGLGEGGEDAPLRVHYRPPADEASRLPAALARYRKALRKLGCVVPPGMEHVRPMGASVHYAGTLPMTEEAVPFTTDAAGASRDLAGLHFVDGTTFPFLPAKNLTFTLMANAHRIAESAF